MDFKLGQYKCLFGMAILSPFVNATLSYSTRFKNFHEIFFKLNGNLWLTDALPLINRRLVGGSRSYEMHATWSNMFSDELFSYVNHFLVFSHTELLKMIVQDNISTWNGKMTCHWLAEIFFPYKLQVSKLQLSVNFFQHAWNNAVNFSTQKL